MPDNLARDLFLYHRDSSNRTLSGVVERTRGAKAAAGFADEDRKYLQMAGEVLADQTRAIVRHWRRAISVGISNLAQHEGGAIPEYLAKSNLRFEQWILETCLRPYDQDWLDYQEEIALRQSPARKKRVHATRSGDYVPLSEAIAFTTAMNDTIKPYLGVKGHSEEQVERMHQAWCKSVQMQLALWARAYMTPSRNEW